MKFVDLKIGQPFRESRLGMIGRITQVHDSYLVGDIREMSTAIVFRRQITIHDLSQSGFSSFHCPTLVEFEIPEGVIVAIPKDIFRHRSRLIGVHGLYRLGRFPLLKLDQEPARDELSVVPLGQAPASLAEIELVQQSLDVELSEMRRRVALEVTDPAECG